MLIPTFIRLKKDTKLFLKTNSWYVNNRAAMWMLNTLIFELALWSITLGCLKPRMTLAELSQWNIYGSKRPGDASYGNVCSIYTAPSLMCSKCFADIIDFIWATHEAGWGESESCLWTRTVQGRAARSLTVGLWPSRKPCLFQGVRKRISFMASAEKFNL